MTAEEDFIRGNTVVAASAFVPEIPLHLATHITPIWQATEAWLAQEGIEPPFWAFAWPGSQAMARLMLDEPTRVAGKRVLDFAAGCGLAAIAAMRAGAASAEAAEIDPLALAATRLNAALNGVVVATPPGDVMATPAGDVVATPAGDVVTAPPEDVMATPAGDVMATPAGDVMATPRGNVGATPAGDGVGSPCRWDLILAGDVCYEAPMTGHILPWLRALAAAGAEVWLADPGRAYLPRKGLLEVARYTVPTTRELEDRETREVVIFRLAPPPRRLDFRW